MLFFHALGGCGPAVDAAVRSARADAELRFPGNFCTTPALWQASDGWSSRVPAASGGEFLPADGPRSTDAPPSSARSSESPSERPSAGSPSQAVPRARSAPPGSAVARRADPTSSGTPGCIGGPRERLERSCASVRSETAAHPVPSALAHTRLSSRTTTAGTTPYGSCAGRRHAGPGSTNSVPTTGRGCWRARH